ncbi:MAG: PEP-CTERM sorting domain-containing protein [Planctomycetota bacterium]
MSITLKQPIAVVAAFAFPAVALAGPGAVFSDDFSDGVIGLQWTQLADNPLDLAIIEENGQVGVMANGFGALTDDALYLSNGSAGFRLSTADPFNMQLDYSYATTADVSSPLEGLALVFGVGVDTDGQDSAAIGFGTANAGIGNLTGATVAFRVDDAQTVSLPDTTVSSTGTFVIDYAPDTDTLTFSTNDGFSDDLTGLVQGIWGTDALFVSFGARGNGFATDQFNSFFDNFVINTGTLVAVPEPASVGLIAFGGLALRRRR